MTHKITIEHEFIPGQPVYIFSAQNAPVKTILKGLDVAIGEAGVKTVYKVNYSDRAFAEDEVYGTVDEVLQAQREILERSE